MSVELERKCYTAWKSMRARCHNINVKSYRDYGGRGIKVDKVWDNYETFRHDLGLPPSKEYQIDRINNNDNYTAANCKWSTRKEQQDNRRNTLFAEIDGERKTIKEWSRDERCSVGYITILGRLKRGWPTEKAFFGPSNKGASLFKKQNYYYVKINNDEKTIRGWSQEKWCTTPYSTIMSRIQKGMDPKKALLQGVNYL